MNLRTVGRGPVVGPRARSSVVTADFEDAWPDVRDPLRRYLGSLGADRHEIDDVVQEVAARVLAHRIPFRDAADLRRWAFVVGRRVYIDEMRSRNRIAPLESAIALADPLQQDSLTRVEDRHLLGTIAVAIAQLPDRDARAIGAELDGDATRAERTRVAVARHRARRRLRRIVGPLAAAVAWLRSARKASRPGVAAATLPAWAYAIAVVIAALPPGVTPAAPTKAGLGGITVHRSGRAAAAAPRPPATRDATHKASPPRFGRAPANRPRQTVVSVRGPAHAWVHAWSRPNDGQQPLVCTRGTYLGDKCVTIPPLPSGVTANTFGARGLA